MGTEKPCSYCGRMFYPLRRGLCKKHYVRLMTHGSPSRRDARGLSPIESVKFHGWNVLETGCWEYQGDRRRGGYGRVSSGGQALVVTRVAYEAWVGPIPEGHVVRHKCDNPPCINPEHLETGTVRDNARDMIERGRHSPPRGELNGQAKLTEDAVREIRRLYEAGTSQRRISEQFDISLGLTHFIVHRKRWAHVV